MTIEEEIALALVDVALENNWFDVVVAEDIAAAVMPLVKRVQAEAWAKGAQWAAVECGVICDEQVAWVVPGDNPYIEKRA